MSERQTGCLPDDHDSFDARFGPLPSSHALVGAAQALPSQALELADALSSQMRDQGPTSSCVGHALCRAADARLRVQGISAPYGSPLAAYTLGRMLGRAGTAGKIPDHGSFPRLVLQGGSDFGVALETKWPLWVGSKITVDLNRELPPDILQKASAWKVQGSYRIYASGAAAGQAAAAALAKNFPILACADVDDAFMQYSGQGVIQPAKGGSGHAVPIIGYRTVDGTRQFLIANSWADWGLAGSLAWVSEAWVSSCFDLYALTFELGPAAGGAELAEKTFEPGPAATSPEIPNPSSEPFLPDAGPSWDPTIPAPVGELEIPVDGKRRRK